MRLLSNAQEEREIVKTLLLVPPIVAIPIAGCSGCKGRPNVTQNQDLEKHVFSSTLRSYRMLGTRSAVHT